jgi:hypothetical protein
MRDYDKGRRVYREVDKLNKTLNNNADLLDSMRKEM